MREYVFENMTGNVFIPVFVMLFIIYVVVKMIKWVKWKRFVYFGTYGLLFLYTFLIASTFKHFEVSTLVSFIGLCIIYYLKWRSHKFCDYCGSLTGPNWKGTIKEYFLVPENCKECGEKLR
jgi:hypothetical protein